MIARRLSTLALCAALAACGPAIDPERERAMQLVYERETKRLAKERAEREAAYAAGKPILIITRAVKAPNSAGGVDVEMKVENISPNVIKYMRFYAVAYNGVGDVAPSRIGGITEVLLRATGPYKKAGAKIECIGRMFGIIIAFDAL